MGLILDTVIVALVLWVVVTQMVIPIVTGSRLFPAFSRQSLELVDELAKVDQEIEAEHLRHTLAQKRRQLDKEQHESL